MAATPEKWLMSVLRTGEAKRKLYVIILCEDAVLRDACHGALNDITGPSLNEIN